MGIKVDSVILSWLFLGNILLMKCNKKLYIDLTKQLNLLFTKSWINNRCCLSQSCCYLLTDKWLLLFRTFKLREFNRLLWVTFCVSSFFANLRTHAWKKACSYTYACTQKRLLIFTNNSSRRMYLVYTRVWRCLSISHIICCSIDSDITEPVKVFIISLIIKGLIGLIKLTYKLLFKWNILGRVYVKVSEVFTLKTWDKRNQVHFTKISTRSASSLLR